MKYIKFLHSFLETTPMFWGANLLSYRQANSEANTANHILKSNKNDIAASKKHWHFIRFFGLRALIDLKLFYGIEEQINGPARENLIFRVICKSGGVAHSVYRRAMS
jgi:hypothetical protein